MPTYDFIDEEGNIFERIMKISERDEFLAQNPNLKPAYISAPSIGDPVRLGVRKIDGGFKEVLQKVSEKTPGGRALTSTQNF